MKTQPTALDREAAELFDCVDGMRAAWLCRGAAGVPRRLRYTWERICDDGKEPDAIDADDPATVGCMLAQVGERVDSIWLQPLWRVSIPADAPYHGETMATVTGRVWSVMTSTGSAGDGPTEGAALVAAMRALKSTPTR